MSMHDSTKPRDANNIWAQFRLLAGVAVILIAMAWRYVW